MHSCGAVAADTVTIQPFNLHNLSLIADEVFPCWSPQAGDDSFKRFVVEYIVRNNIFENEYRFELDAADGTLLAAAFFARKGDVCTSGTWFTEGIGCAGRFSEDLKTVAGGIRTYLELMDKKTFALMDETDIKLSLFVGRKRGCGAVLFDSLWNRLKSEGWKNLYLWTDCECNWQWYGKHGFTLVAEDLYKPFCRAGTDYKTYIFKKSLR